jgi:hypothetical protein
MGAPDDARGLLLELARRDPLAAAPRIVLAELSSGTGSAGLRDSAASRAPARGFAATDVSDSVRRRLTYLRDR